MQLGAVRNSSEQMVLQILCTRLFFNFSFGIRTCTHNQIMSCKRANVQSYTMYPLVFKYTSHFRLFKNSIEFLIFDISSLRSRRTLSKRGWLNVLVFHVTLSHDYRKRIFLITFANTAWHASEKNIPAPEPQDMMQILFDVYFCIDAEATTKHNFWSRSICYLLIWRHCM